MRRLFVSLPGALNPHHRSPSVGLVLILIALVALYVAWRTKRLGRLREMLAARRMRGELRDTRLSPFSFLPLAVLVIVVVILLVSH